MNIPALLKTQRLILDGGMGTMLSAMGLLPGQAPETWNLSRPEAIQAVHKSYLQAGAQILTANTFGVNPLKYSDAQVEELVSSAITIARSAIAQEGKEAAVALDIGPCGKLLRPYGDLGFEEAVAAFAKVVRAGVKAGADLVIAETFHDAYETKAVVLAVKENCELPLFVSNVYDESGKLLTGADIPAMVALLEGLGADAIGMNCSLGPVQMQGLLSAFCEHSSTPILVMPNAGLPRVENGITCYDVTADGFASAMSDMATRGAGLLGGCCGTTPEYIEKMALAVSALPYTPPTQKKKTVISSYTHAVEIGDTPILIGERINPTGKPKLKTALREKDTDYICRQALLQQDCGVQVLDVNVGIPEIDEGIVLPQTVQALQAITDLPLQLDSADPVALEGALRIYNGKPLLNSVNGKEESMEAILPLAKKYGACVIALTLDESGIPETAQGRIKIAEKILTRAKQYGIPKEDIIFDPLALTIASDPQSALVTLETLRILHFELGCKTSLGVSNISFGLPRRELVHSTFFTLALGQGLDCAIMNPFSREMMHAYYAFSALTAQDKDCAAYIAYATALPAAQAGVPAANATTATAPGTLEEEDPLRHAILRGLSDSARASVQDLLAKKEPTAIITEHIVPALNEVGIQYENKKLFLPQLLLSAETARSAFEVLQQSLPKGSDNGNEIILATVQGDIHDIGKNIVRVLLENFGFSVIDLGKDVPPEVICAEAQKRCCRLVGLSALMTTTVPKMEETIALLRKTCPACKVIVGGAVLTAEYAAAIGADAYGADAMETVRYAQKLFHAM